MLKASRGGDRYIFFISGLNFSIIKLQIIYLINQVIVFEANIDILT